MATKESERERAILRATYDLLGEVGYQGLRVDAVAARARASKATLYRHWPTKAGLVADSIRVCKGAEEALPDTGDLRTDLLTWFTALADTVSGEEGPLLSGLIMAMHRDPELAAELRSMHSSKKPAAELICKRAASRGELPGTYRAELIDEIVPPLLFMHHFAHGEPLDAAFLAHVVDDIILPLLRR